MRLNDLEVKLKGLRNKISSDKAYPVRSNPYTILDFLKKFGEPIKSKKQIVYIDKEKKYPKYFNITTIKDIITDNLSVVCMAYDSVVDRFITWFKEQWRVPLYELSLRQGSHIGTIGIIDLKENIKSLEELKKRIDFLDYIEAINSEINYWKKYYLNADGSVKFRFYVIVGKNRALFALPRIYETHVLNGRIEEISELLELEVKVWTKYVSRAFKTELYRNEKNNMKDTELQELIGWGGDLSSFISKYPKNKLVKKLLPQLFSDEHLLMIKDREMLVEFNAVLNKIWGSSGVVGWIKTQFVEGRKVRKDFEKHLDYFFNLINAWVTFRENKEHTRYQISSGSPWRIVIFNLVVNIMEEGMKINLSGKKLYKKVIETALLVRADLEHELETFGFVAKKGTPLSVLNLMGGLKSTMCWYNKDFSPFDTNFVFNEDEMKKNTEVVYGYQYTIMMKIFLNRFWEYMTDESLLILPAKRNFKPTEVSSIGKRDRFKVRINGQVYNSNDELIKFSEEHPNDPYILKHGNDIDYVQLEYSEYMGENVQIDHIPPYAKNKETKDLDLCEAASSTFNNWKSDREAVYQSKVLQNIQLRKEDMNA
jgi:hypothetical protein|tara:strand:- start:190 stop:1974 length:1785 start_codon:yes stop_codon:yes gene_type:complete